MSTLNGFGTKYLGYTAPDDEGNCYATEWVVALYFPVFPLARRKLCGEFNARGDKQFYLLGKTPLVTRELIQTYLWGFIVVPVLVLLPLLLMMVLAYAGIIVDHSTAFGLFFIIGIVWLLASIFLLIRWDSARGVAGTASLLSKVLGP